MISRWQWIMAQIGQRLWVRAGLFGLLAVAVALFGIWGQHWVPERLGGLIGANAVDHILDILATSMLAVTTFSLSVMVTAHGVAAAQATPRSTQLLLEDSSTQNALAAFVGSFLFSLVSIIALTTGLYGERGRVILFVATLLVIVLVVATLLRWIDHLARLGHLTQTTDRVESAAGKALADRLAHPCLGAAPLTHRAPPDGALPVTQDKVGYVQHLDVAGLASLAEELDAEIWVTAPPGTFLHPALPLAWLVGGRLSEDSVARLRDTFVVGDQRSFRQDPRFGLAVLAEIASRALSPAVNDAGTAIDVIARGVRLLSRWPGVAEQAAMQGAARHRRLRLAPLSIADLFDDLFGPIERDGAASLAVQMRLQKALRVLHGLDDPAARLAARDHARLALKRALAALPLREDQLILEDLAAWAVAEGDPPRTRQP